MIFEYLQQFIGVPPVGYEWLEYAFSGVFFLLIFQFLTDLFRNVASWLNLRR
jgi:hypothetical protein